SRPGLTVRARRGYVATAKPQETTAMPGETASSSLAVPNSTVPNSSISTLTIPNPTIPTGSFDPTLINPAVSTETAPPKSRPNVERNVGALTKIAPSGAASAAKALA